jgi:hypothetical protein
MCHTPNAGFVLGPKTHQLNGKHTYPNGRTDNQLRTWNYLGMFSAPLDESNIKEYPHSCPIDDEDATLEKRFRSYLDANCASCHRPGGNGAQWDARFETPLAKQGIINGEVRNALGLTDGRLIAPGEISKSIIHHRMNSTLPAEQMPPLTRNVVDIQALVLLKQWIESLPTSEAAE